MSDPEMTMADLVAIIPKKGDKVIVPALSGIVHIAGLPVRL